jgi:phosphate starvation-inducible PhoH-like protein
MDAEIPIKDHHEALQLLGMHDRNLKLVRDAFEVGAVARRGKLVFNGAPANVRKAVKAINQMIAQIKASGELGLDDVRDIIEKIDAGVRDPGDPFSIEVFSRGTVIQPRTDGQKRYVAAVNKKPLVFCIGPAGTGKTYLAVAMALQALKRRDVRRIILARPAVEAGEKLGFLPGDMVAKVNPYLRPLYDALNDMMDFGQLRKYQENDLIEVIPLAYMRGRTLNHAFIILDEAQNCTRGQMKMCLTRMGEDSRAIVTGDITQIDLPAGEVSGLVAVQTILRGVRGIEFIHLERSDIVRHRLVQDIVQAYERQSQLTTRNSKVKE